MTTRSTTAATNRTTTPTNHDNGYEDANTVNHTTQSRSTPDRMPYVFATRQ